MADKVQKIREEVEKLKSNLIYGACSSQIAMETRCKEEAYDEVLAILDTMQEESIDYDKLNTMLNDALSKETKESWNEMLGKEEPISNDFEMALTEMIDKAQKCVVEPWAIAAQWKDYLIELAKSEEPVSEIDFEQELYKAFGHVKDFTLGMQIAKRFYDMGRNHQEPVSEDLEEAADNALNNVLNTHDIVNVRSCLEMFRFGADWQKQQMMKGAVEATVLENYDGKVLSYDEALMDNKNLCHCCVGDKVKVIIIKTEDLQLQGKCFIAFRRKLNPVMRELVKN